MTLRAHLDLRRKDFHLAASFTCPSKGITAVFGPSGCGKTTLLRNIAGLERHPGTSVWFQETAWQDGTTWVPPHQRGTALVFQKPALFGHRTVEANLRYGWKRTPEADRRFSPAEIIDRLELAPLLHRRAGSLSGGEGQRVAIGRALLAGPGILLMDEPLSALDQEAKQRIFPFLEQLRPLGIPVLLVSHSLEEVARLADHVLVMGSGSVTQSGAAAEVLSDPEHGLGAHEHAQCILDGTVTGTEGGGIRIDTPAGPWLHAPPAHPPGTPVRLRIHARDVSIARTRHTDTSIRNLREATIHRLHPLPGGRHLLQLTVGDARLLSLITTDAVDHLRLAPGDAVIAQVKSLHLATPG
jgi:molybdate transport system ATP-binding protein